MYLVSFPAPRLHRDSPVCRFLTQIGMIAGFFTARPVNAWLIRAGIKEAMQHRRAGTGACLQGIARALYRTAVQAPRMDAICERLVATVRRELPGRVLILGESHLRMVLANYQAHCNTARPHQGIAQRTDGERDGGHLTVAGLGRERVHRKLALGGLINEYSRAA